MSVETTRNTQGGEVVVSQDKTQQSGSSEGIHMDIVFQILSLLPVKSVRRFICVCKSWSNLISDSLFVKSHLNQSITANRLKYCVFKRHRRFEFDYEDLISGQKEINIKSIDDGRLFGPIITGIFGREREVWGSCNGLLCVLTAPRILVLANPSTRETKTIFCKYSPKKKFFDNMTLGGGFGYDSVNDDFKVVKINPLIRSMDVYSLKKSTWNFKGSFPYKNAKIRGSASIFLNGAIHWSTCFNRNVPDGKFTIVAFDLTKEELVEIPSPTNSALNHGLNTALGPAELNTNGKHLCLTYSPTIGEYDIWIMETYGVKESWKRTRLTLDRFFYSLKLLDFPDSEVALYYSRECFLLENRLDKSTRWVNCNVIGEDVGFHTKTTAFSFVESLISLGPGSKIVKELKNPNRKRKQMG